MRFKDAGFADGQSLRKESQRERERRAEKAPIGGQTGKKPTLESLRVHVGW